MNPSDEIKKGFIELMERPFTVFTPTIRFYEVADYYREHIEKALPTRFCCGAFTTYIKKFNACFKEWKKD